MGRQADIVKILGRHWADSGVLYIKFLTELSVLLMQDKTFQFSYPRCDFLVFLSKIRLFSFLIQDETFWFLSMMRLFGFLIQDKTFWFSYPR